MKIIMFAGYFYPHKGGSEDYIYNLSSGLINKNHDVDILTNNTEKVSSYETKDKIKIYRLDCWSSLNNKYPIPKPTIRNLKMFSKLLKKKYDIVNPHTRFWVTSFLGLLFAFIKNIPLVHFEHGTVHTKT